MTEQLWQLRYRPGAHDDRFARIRYPARKGVNQHTAELMRAAMPRPDDFELVACDEEGD